jgi:hypothetical protein
VPIWLPFVADDLKPRLVLRFGVTGHRPPRLSETAHAGIHAACTQVFTLAKATLAELHAGNADLFSPAPPAAVLVTSLAEGADVVVAEAALECGLSISACLPFPSEVYTRDFEPERWLASERLIGRSEGVFELGEQLGGNANGYEAAGRLMMSQADILIAVWDGDPANGPGGTAQIVAESIALHLPVIHINPAKPGSPRLIWPGLENADGDLLEPTQDASADFRTRLAAVVEHLMAPPQGEERASLEAYLRRPPATTGAAFAWPLLLAITGARKWRDTRFCLGGAAQSREWLAGKTAPFAGHGSFGDTLNGALLARYAQADAEANRFAMRYRSTFLTNFAMAGLAVLLALSSLLLPSLKLVLILLELLVIGLIMLNTQAGRQNNLHQCWLDRRQVAERLRMLVLTAPLGHLGLRSGEDGHAAPGWVHWYVRASARELGMPSARIDQAYLETTRRDLIELVDEQGSYHRGNAHAMAHADHSLHHTGDLLFFGTVLACLVFIAAYLLSEDSHFGIAGMGGAELVTFVTALFPALAAALYGIRMQGDFAASSRRSAGIARRLRRLRSRIEHDPLTYQNLVDRARAVREILLAEVQQWRSHYESRPLTLPG